MSPSTGRRRWEEDEVDRACNAWAYQWVAAYANAPEPGHRIGALGCTLGRVRELWDAAASTTARDQHYPEVFLGEGLIVAIALQAMSDISGRMIWRHYVERWFDWSESKKAWVRRARPIKQAVMAERAGLGLSDYYLVRNAAKLCVGTVLSLDSKGLARLATEPHKTRQVG